MQNDDDIRQEFELEAASQSEGYRKQLALLLQRRRQVRQTLPATNDVALSATPPPISAIVPAKEASAIEQPEKVVPRQSFALVVASYSFRNLPPLSEKTKDAATSLFNSLVDQHFNSFSRRGSQLLLNPSVIEFQDTMKDIQQICAEEPNSSFFLFLSTHGARVTRGENEGSYVLFSETRLTSEEELLLTAVHERELAEMIQGIPCKHKFIALELCQTQEPKEQIIDDAVTIRHRIHDQFLPRLHKKLVQHRRDELLNSGFRLSEGDGSSMLTEDAVRTNPKLLNLIMVESCSVANEVPVRANEGNVSNFLLRLRDAFRGGAIVPDLANDRESQQKGPVRASLFAKCIVEYVCQNVRNDAAKHNAQVHAEYKSQVRTKYEHAAEFQDITHTPNVMGAEHAMDFGLGTIPEPPTVAPSPPTFIASTLNSIRVEWNFAHPNMLSELPTILGFHVQRRGHGRACADSTEEAGLWKHASAFQVLSYGQVVRENQEPPTATTAYGLQPDTAYCFRVRARTAGGWGPFSEITPGYRTLSTVSTTDQLETVRIAAVQGGVGGIVALMKKRSSVGSVQRLAVEVLAKMAIQRPASAATRENPAERLLVASDLPLVITVRDAMQKFMKDVHLQQHACLLFGRLAASSDSWHTALLSVRNPSIMQILLSVANRSGSGHKQELLCSAKWALHQLQSGTAASVRRAGPALSPHEAAARIQGLYRYRKAREHMRIMAQSVYSQEVDPTTGTRYFINARTGASFWALPSFIS